MNNGVIGLTKTKGKPKKKRQGWIHDIKTNPYLYVMMLPALVYWIIFNYIPTGGVIIAFKEFRFDLGIIRSPWVGMDNFRIFLGNERFINLIRMTAFYSIAFMFVGLVTSVGLALLLSEIGSKYFKKISHSLIFLPYFVSWVVVSFIAFALFNNRAGMLPALLSSIGINFNFYTTPWIWPFILTGATVWKSVGYGSIIYLAVITGTDPQLHESARVDGASVWQRIWHVSLPLLRPTIILLTIMSLAGILSTNGEMFFQLVGNNVMLHRTADTIDAHILRSILMPGGAIRFEQLAALGFFQQFIGFVMIMLVNTIVKVIAPERAIF